MAINQETEKNDYDIITDFKYTALIKALLDSTALNHRKDDLCISYDSPVCVIAKYLEPGMYEGKLIELIEEEARKNNDEQ